MTTAYSPLISDLREKTEFEGAYLAKVVNLQTDKNGKPYLQIILMDKSGEIEARVWDDALDLYEKVKAQSVVRVVGKVNQFQGRRQVTILNAATAAPGSYPMDRFFPTTAYNVDRMYADLLALMGTVENEHARKLALSILEDKELKPKIQRAPAAKSVHHAYVGGLLEHVLSVCRILDFLGKHYTAYYGKAVDRDMLLLGGLFHDIGKLFELKYEGATEYTTSGQLVGHLVQGCELVDSHIARIPGFPERMRLHVKHMILAHHGKLEYGSPKLPQTTEALIVHYVDDLDSKVNMILKFIEKDEQPGEFTLQNRMFERMFWRPEVAPKMQGESPGIG